MAKSIPWWVKAIIAGGAVGGIIYLGYEAVKSLSTPPGGSCNDPSSPCYQALQPYKEQFQICADEYAKDLDAFIKEDSQQGTSFTQSQLDTLNYLTNCMNQAAEKMAQVAKQYAPDTWPEIIEGIIFVALVAVLAKYGLSKYIEAKTKPRNGATAATVMYKAFIQDAVDTGIISSINASALMTTTQIEENNLTQIDTAYYQELVNLNIISETLATQLLNVELTEMSADFASLLQLLSILR
jgi:hypothetical protein